MLGLASVDLFKLEQDDFVEHVADIITIGDTVLAAGIARARLRRVEPGHGQRAPGLHRDR